MVRSRAYFGLNMGVFFFYPERGVGERVLADPPLDPPLIAEKIIFNTEQKRVSRCTPEQCSLAEKRKRKADVDGAIYISLFHYHQLFSAGEHCSMG